MECSAEHWILKRDHASRNGITCTLKSQNIHGLLGHSRFSCCCLLSHRLNRICYWSHIDEWLTDCLTDWLTPCSTVLLEKPTVHQLAKKLSAFYGTRKFITAFTNARHLSLSWARQILSMLPYLTSSRPILIWCDFDRASSLICGNEMPTRCNRGFYCRSYCLPNMFRAPLCPSSGAQEYCTVVAACGISCCSFQVALCVL